MFEAKSGVRISPADLPAALLIAMHVVIGNLFQSHFFCIDTAKL